MVERAKGLRPDFDMKRRPVEKTMSADQVPYDSELYEVAHLRTEPWNSVAEFERAKRIQQERTDCLRTLADWRTFFARLRNDKTTGRRIADGDWSVLKSLVAGHRLGFWTIPALDDPSTSRQEKFDWINAWGIAAKQFGLNDWKNVGRSERQSQVLPRSELEPWLSRRESYPLGVMPTQWDIDVDDLAQPPSASPTPATDPAGKRGTQDVDR